MALAAEKLEEMVEVDACPLQVGATYPILGMITKILEEGPERAVVRLGNSIRAVITLQEPGVLDTLKEKAFETGIFVSTVVALEPETEVECRAVIFGRSPRYSA